MSDSLWHCELQHGRPPCPTLSPGVCPSSCSLNQWCHPIISSSVALFFCLQSFPASGSFPMRWLFASGGQSIGTSTSAPVLPKNIKYWFPLEYPCCPKDSQDFSSTTVQNKFFSAQAYLWSNSHIHTCLLEKPWLWLHGALSAKWCFCFLMYCLGLSPLFFQVTVAAVTVHVDFGSPRKWNLILFSRFWNLSQLFHSLLLPSSRSSLVPLHFLPLKWYYLHIWGCWYFTW